MGSIDRRDFTKLLLAGSALGAVGGNALAAEAESTSSTSLSAAKKRAARHFHGFENSVRPAFSPDFKSLDEEGIRHEVRQSIAHGVFAIFLAPGELTDNERRQFYEIVADENDGRVLLSTYLSGPDLKSHIAQAKLAEEAGFNHVLAHPPHGFEPKTEQELYDYYSKVANSTDLDIVLWATDGTQMRALHQSNVVLNVLDRVADLPNVVALKLMATLNPVMVFECFQRLGDRLQINCVDLRMMPLLVDSYGVQWSGAWTIEALQSPDKPYVVRYLELLREGRYDEATALFWDIKPAYDALMGLMAPMLPKGVHPGVQLKYYQWCVGGNGGLPRLPSDTLEQQFPLTPEQRKTIKAAYRAIGIEPQGPEESFIVGRAAYERGVRAKDLAQTPMYVPG